jgi:hypothetical protein
MSFFASQNDVLVERVLVDKSMQTDIADWDDPNDGSTGLLKSGFQSINASNPNYIYLVRNKLEIRDSMFLAGLRQVQSVMSIEDTNEVLITGCHINGEGGQNRINFKDTVKKILVTNCTGNTEIMHNGQIVGTVSDGYSFG